MIEDDVKKTIHLIEDHQPDYPAGFGLIGGLAGYFISKSLKKDFYPFVAIGSYVGYRIGKQIQQRSIQQL